MFDEGKRLILPLVGGTMKKYQLGPAALMDEVRSTNLCSCISSQHQVYLFRRTITLEKESLAPTRNISSPLLDNEDSMDAPRCDKCSIEMFFSGV